MDDLGYPYFRRPPYSIPKLAHKGEHCATGRPFLWTCNQHPATMRKSEVCRDSQQAPNSHVSSEKTQHGYHGLGLWSWGWSTMIYWACSRPFASDFFCFRDVEVSNPWGDFHIIRSLTILVLKPMVTTGDASWLSRTPMTCIPTDAGSLRIPHISGWQAARLKRLQNRNIATRLTFTQENAENLHTFQNSMFCVFQTVPQIKYVSFQIHFRRNKVHASWKLYKTWISVNRGRWSTITFFWIHKILKLLEGGNESWVLQSSMLGF